jgi:hypothetical protein
MLLMVHRWLPNRPIMVVADNSFDVLELREAVRRKVCMVSRLRLDAALYDPAYTPATRDWSTFIERATST